MMHIQKRLIKLGEEVTQEQPLLCRIEHLLNFHFTVTEKLLQTKHFTYSIHCDDMSYLALRVNEGL